MAIRKTKPPADPTIPKRPPIAWCDAICRRFLKPGQNIHWAREMPTYSRLWKAYPSQPFWEAYELPFGNGSLNMMTWFESPEGVEELKRAWLLFHYNPPAPEVVSLDTAAKAALDTTPQPAYNPPKPRPRTVAEFLR